MSIRRFFPVILFSVSFQWVWADDAPTAEAAGLGLTQHRATVPAGIVKGMQRAVTGPGHQDALVTDPQAPEVAGLQPIFLAPDAEPIDIPDRPKFPAVLVGIVKPARGERLPVRCSIHGDSVTPLKIDQIPQ